MPQIEINGKNLNYIDVGEGPSVLMGHSYLWDSHMWDDQVELLSKNYRCIVPDLWGHGKSGLLPDEAYSLTELADDYLLFMERLVIESFSIIGLSVGGMWGTELARKAPHLVRSLVLMDTFVGEEPGQSKEFYFGMLDAVARGGAIPELMIEQLVAIFLSPHTLEKKPHIADRFRSDLKAFTVEQIPTVVTLGKAIFGRRDLLDELKNISIPTLIMAGEDDRPRPVVEARKMADLIDGAQFISIPEAGHIPAKEQPQAVSDSIIDFLGACRT